MNAHKTTYIPLGCDQQGRHPEAAHAASEIVDEELDLPECSGIVIAVAAGLAVWAVAIGIALMPSGWFF